jgi:hypothetical protein
MATQSGPFLTFAVICERVLREVDGVASLVRIVDKWTISGPLPKMVPVALPIWLAVGFKSGKFRGKSVVTIRPKSPSGQVIPGIEQPVLFEGEDDNGVNVFGQLNFVVQEEGIYWFSVLLDEVEVTQLPLRIVYQQVALATSAV